MNVHLQNKLFVKYHKIFSKYFEDKYESRMYLGICCEDGWYEIIDNLCEKIQNYCDRYLLDEMQVQAVEVKETFGKLYFFIFGGDKKIYKLIKKAQEKSEKTCEICGAQEKVQKNNDKTRCESCINI